MPRPWINGLLLIGVILFSVPQVDATDYGPIKADIDAGHSEAAVNALNELVGNDPDDYQAWFLLGVAASRQQQFQQAIEAFRKVIELRPELAEPHNNLAVIYNEQGDVRAAVKELEASLVKRPGYAIAEENIGDLYVKLALEHYRNAMEKGGNAPLQQRYTRLLQLRDSATANVPVTVPAASDEVAVQRKKKPEPALGADVGTAAKRNAGISGTDREQILAAIEQWRSAWSSRDVDGYFDAYAADFRVPDRFGTLAEWKKYKRRVISSKAWISVEISKVRIEIDSDTGHARVNFFQKFRSNSYNGDDLKILQMVFDRDRWKIVSED